MNFSIISGGPRGMSMVERVLCNRMNKQVLELILFDPVGTGGRESLVT